MQMRILLLCTLALLLTAALPTVEADEPDCDGVLDSADCTRDAYVNWSLDEAQWSINYVRDLLY